MKTTTQISQAVAALSVFFVGNIVAQSTSTRLAGANVICTSELTNLPNFIKLEQEQQRIKPESFISWAEYSLNLPNGSTLKPYSVEKDKLGFTHTRYKQYVDNYPVEASQVITHERNGKIETVNGDYYQNFSSNISFSLNEQQALTKALAKVNAQRYMWENKQHEADLKETFNNPNFTFYPKGELVIVHKQKASYGAENMRLAYKFNIYAEVPLYRANVFVDAQTGEILAEHNLIQTTDVVVPAVTKFSGTVNMTMDNYGTNQYRLRETGRGNGITTKNLSNGTNYGTATDFTTAVNTWTVTGTNQAAADAHAGAEATYDYYKNIHGRNSIDGSGYALPSYVHYSTNYVNAFWDGTEMTYGDGQVSQGFLIMTALDVCGHEISHGLTSFTSQLNGGGTDEASALNEGNSDIMGTTIEWYARPSQHDWIMGADITCNSSGVQDHLGIRDMSNPNAFAQPDTYMGTNWDPAGECHNNNGPFIFWYYLLCQGGSGTNDISNAYNVTGITMDEAKFIAFRQNTVYFTQNTTYATARNYSIQAATDLYGACSQEVASTTNAWYAVGVGAAASNGVPTASFASANTSSCSAPLAVSFANTSTGASSYAWNFGDGVTSTSVTPAHTYTAPGVYAVTLVATGTCSASSKDTLVKTSFIKINGAPTITGAGTSCSPTSFTLTANSVGSPIWKDGSGTTVSTSSVFVTPTLSTTTSYSVTSSIPSTGTVITTGGPATNTTLGAGAYLGISNNHYLIFNATTGFTFKTVDIYVQSTTSVTTIQLEDASSNVLYSITPTLSTTGKNTITLNWHIPTGTGYKLMAVGTNNLYRNSAGATFPIAVSTVASITATDVSSTNPAYYYWFYNWNVAADITCTSVATVATNTIGSGTPAIFNYTGSSLCSAGSSITLTATPSGGTYSGTGVSGSSFNPSGLNGNYILTYSYTSGGCTSTDTAKIKVNQTPTVAFNYTGSSLCSNGSNLSLSGTPSGGTYSGTGVSGSSFNPTGLSGNYILTYSYTSNGCSNSDTAHVNVNQAPTVAFNYTGSALCSNDASISLTGTPTGGTYSGTGVSGSSFNPTGLNGNYVLTYSYSSNGCTNSDTAHVNVNQTPTVTFNYAGSSLCNNGTSISLTGTPTGGTYSGTGVSGSQFNPNGLNGNYVITYSYTSNGCSNSDTANIDVNQTPTVTFDYTGSSLCSGGSSVNLSGAPSGGTYSGTGISGTSFNPNGLNGSYVLTYSYTSNGCSNSDTTAITVNQTPAVVFDYSGSSVCDTANSINLSATPTGGTYSGTGVSGSSFNPNGLNGNYILTYTYSSNGCSNSDTANLTVIQCTASSGISRLDNGSFIEVYPNPATSNVYIKCNENIVSYTVTDVLGQSILVQNNNVGLTTQVDFGSLTSGVYFIKVVTSSQQKLVRIIKE